MVSAVVLEVILVLASRVIFLVILFVASVVVLVVISVLAPGVIFVMILVAASVEILVTVSAADLNSAHSYWQFNQW